MLTYAGNFVCPGTFMGSFPKFNIRYEFWNSTLESCSQILRESWVLP